MQLKKCCLFLGIALPGENKKKRKILLQSINISRLSSVNCFRQLSSVD